jgi:MarR family transcriptional regulator, organic hydroperoxide resistance regulator
MNYNNIISLISLIRNLANEFIINELKKEGIKNIAPSHGFILHTLFNKDGITMKEINEIINKKKNTVTVLIDKLESMEYLRKETDIDDKRITRIFLTEKGKSFEKSFKRLSDKLIKKAYAGIAENEKLNLMKYLDKIKKNFI